jgi:CheY-like chemotaxis protein
VYLEVEDSGSGMDSETQQRVFDPFFTTRFTGRGLGLAVIQGIVRGHEGGIRLRSELRRGTSFRVFFACGERPVPPPPQKAELLGDWRGEGGVLVVDDDTDVRDLAGIMLRRLGFTVYTAADGREGVAAFREHAREIDVVLLDLTMPGMSGGEACREMLGIEPDQRIVLMSGYNEEIAASRAVGGTAGFLQKPFTQEDLGATLRAVLEKTSRGEAPDVRPVPGPEVSGGGGAS